MPKGGHVGSGRYKKYLIVHHDSVIQLSRTQMIKTLEELLKPNPLYEPYGNDLGMLDINLDTATLKDCSDLLKLILKTDAEIEKNKHGKLNRRQEEF